MRLRVLVACALFAQSLFAADLTGLWKAKRWHGPFARGTVIVRKEASGYTADMIGKVVPVQIENGAISFELPNKQGAFRGRWSGKSIRGHWFAGNEHATPLRLEPDGANRWRGEVVPFDSVFTFYLALQKRADGSIGAYLRNPERAWGAEVDRLSVDGNVVKLFTKEREFAAGTYNAQQDVITLALRGGTYDFRRESDEQSDFYARGRNPGRYVHRPPLARDDGWPVGTLDDAGIDGEVLEKFIRMILDKPIESSTTPVVEAVLIARHGKLVVEEYFFGEHRDKLHETRSASKSVTATVVGAAMQAGAPLASSTRVYELMNMPDVEPRKRAMTLEHLLTMTSGFFCDDNNDDAPGREDTIWEQTEEPHFYRFTLRLPMALDPGEKAIYCSCNPNLALAMVGKATGESPMETFDRLIGEPLKIHRYAWLLDRAGNPYGGGMKVLPRDLMKFGQLMLNGGTWQGRRILSRDFVSRASSPLHQIGKRKYGYLWWVDDLPYRGRTVRVFNAAGHGGQTVTVVPELDLVIGLFGASYRHAPSVFAIGDLRHTHVLPAVRP